MTSELGRMAGDTSAVGGFARVTDSHPRSGDQFTAARPAIARMRRWGSRLAPYVEARNAP
jgi:hypothetical protein